MQQNEKPTLHYRHGEEQCRIIEDDIALFERQYKSDKDFTRQAINNDARSYRDTARGGKAAKLLVLLLDEIRGMDEKLLDRSARARIKNEGLTDNLSISLDEQAYGWIKDGTKETQLDKSKATRYCTVGQLAKIARGTDVLAEWQHDAIIQTQMELKKSQKSKTESLLHPC